MPGPRERGWDAIIGRGRSGAEGVLQTIDRIPGVSNAVPRSGQPIWDKPSPAMQNVRYYPSSDYISDDLDIDAAVVCVTVNGSGSGPLDEAVKGTLDTNLDPSGIGFVSHLFVGNSDYNLIPIVRWLTSDDGGAIGAFAFTSGLVLGPYTGTYSLNVQVAW